jgi:hypothetical protein
MADNTPDDEKVVNHDTAILAGLAIVCGVVLCIFNHPDTGATLITAVSVFAFTKPLIRGDN